VRRLSVIVAALLAACAQRELPLLGHVVLYVDTDAPVPTAPGKTRDPNAPAPLFDRVRVEIFKPGEREPCAPCSREFDVDEALLRGGASFTVLGGAGLRARVRLFRSASVIDGAIPPRTAIDTWIALPAPPPEGPAEAHLLLGTDDVGTTKGTPDTPLPAAPGRPASSAVGTWAAAQRVPCNGDPKPGEVCVPGGAYWMGNPHVRESPLVAADVQRLVVLAPFFMDDHEVTVGEFRALLPGPNHAIPWSGGATGAAFEDYCRWTDALGPYEAFPINCVGYKYARQVCQKKGGDLPSEAEFEYVAGALESRLYPWGEDEPSCDDAIYARAGVGVELNSAAKCRAKAGSDPGGPLPLAPNADLTALAAASRLRARLDLPTGSLWDVAGNLGEYMLDAFATETDSCWADAKIYVNPVCDKPTPNIATDPAAEVRSVRGGSWLNEQHILRAASRDAQRVDNGRNHEFVGFRCVRPG
jgi:formylglycine-generating enzyme required for sulfatase activity